MRHRFQNILLAVTLCVCSTSLALGASVTINPAGRGVFAVQGDNMNGVSGIEITIGYDASALASPEVKWGSLISGALSVANTTVPGTIRMAIIRTAPFSGSGQIAEVSFAKQSGSGGITSASARMTDINGVKISVLPGAAADTAGITAVDHGSISTAGVTSGQTATAGLSKSDVAAKTTSLVSTVSGTAAVPDDKQSISDLQPGEILAERNNETTEVSTRQAKQSPAEHGVDTGKSADVKHTVYGSILDRFRTYRGERTPENLVGLFNKSISPFISQEPAVVVSDGKSTVQITVDLPAKKDAPVFFTLYGAKQVSLKKVKDTGTWVLIALPQRNTVKATVALTDGNSVTEFPLTVVPPAAVSDKQSDFAAFLKDAGAKTPKHDLNSDGRHDYIDDFIYTANYMISSNTAAK